jgi:hypothetical protein
VKKISIFVFIFLLSIVSAFAQTEDALQAYANALKAYDDAAQHLQRLNLRAQKREIIQQAISLSSEQSAAFWKVYDKYEAETVRINDTRLGLITDYLSHREELSANKATELINDLMKVQLKRLESKRAYVKELGRVLTAKQALRLLLLENQIDVQLDAAIAAQIPIQ